MHNDIWCELDSLSQKSSNALNASSSSNCQDLIDDVTPCMDLSEVHHNNVSVDNCRTTDRTCEISQQFTTNNDLAANNSDNTNDDAMLLTTATVSLSTLSPAVHPSNVPTNIDEMEFQQLNKSVFSMNENNFAIVVKMLQRRPQKEEEMKLKQQSLVLLWQWLVMTMKIKHCQQALAPQKLAQNQRFRKLLNLLASSHLVKMKGKSWKGCIVWSLTLTLFHKWHKKQIQWMEMWTMSTTILLPLCCLLVLTSALALTMLPVAQCITVGQNVGCEEERGAAVGGTLNQCWVTVTQFPPGFQNVSMSAPKRVTHKQQRTWEK